MSEPVSEPVRLLGMRRYLGDEEYLTREAGAYWRTGGPVDV